MYLNRMVSSVPKVYQGHYTTNVHLDSGWLHLFLDCFRLFDAGTTQKQDKLLVIYLMKTHITHLRLF